LGSQGNEMMNASYYMFALIMWKAIYTYQHLVKTHLGAMLLNEVKGIGVTI